MYGKFFQSTFTGSMFGSGVEVFAVWGYIIANAREGRIEINPVMLAATLGCSVSLVESALEYLTEPDPRSRSKDQEGRRLLKEGEYQYHVVNFDAYRKIQNEDERREYNRIKQQESRAKRSGSNVKTNVNDSQESLLPLSSESEGIGDARGKGRCTQAESEAFCESIGLPKSDGEAMFLHWEEKGWAKVKDWRLTIKKWKSFGYLPSQKGKHGPYKGNRAEGARNVGTANEGKSAQYKGVGRI